MKTHRSTNALDRAYLEGKWREGTQRNLVAAALRSGKPWTLQSLVTKLDGPAYWNTVKHKNKNGEPSEESWFVTTADAIRGSIRYHLNELKNDGLVKILEG